MKCFKLLNFRNNTLISGVLEREKSACKVLKKIFPEAFRLIHCPQEYNLALLDTLTNSKKLGAASKRLGKKRATKIDRYDYEFLNFNDVLVSLRFFLILPLYYLKICNSSLIRDK